MIGGERDGRVSYMFYYICTGVLIDECSLGIDKCSESNSVCVDEEKGYTCVCRPGYRNNSSDQCVGMKTFVQNVREMTLSSPA